MLATVFFIGLEGRAFPASINIQEWTFDGNPPGSAPGNFVPGKLNSMGQWRVVEDPTAPTSPHVLVRERTDDANPQVIFIDGLESSSLDLTVRVKTSPDGQKQGAGVVFRAIDERNYYLISISYEDMRLRLDRLVDGEIRHLQDLNLDSADLRKWHTLRLTIHGPVMEATFNNRQFLSGREEKWEFGTYQSGKIGLWASGLGPVYFDNLRYTNMDESTSSSRPFGFESGSVPQK